MKLWIVLSLLMPGIVFSQAESAGAGNEGGNGGDVVICTNENGTSQPVLLDYFESLRKINISGYENAFEKVKVILKRLAKHDPVRARLYEEGLNSFLAEAFFIRNFNLPEIKDEGWIHSTSRFRIKRRCLKKQAVIQVWRPDFNENYDSWSVIRQNRYFIDGNIWDQLDATNKAGLIIHELLVREGVNLLGTTDTKEIRMMNRYWSSPRLIHDSTSEYEFKIQKLGFGVLR